MNKYIVGNKWEKRLDSTIYIRVEDKQNQINVPNRADDVHDSKHVVVV